MSVSKIYTLSPDAPLPVVDTPFAVLLDTDEVEWVSESWVCRKANELLKNGCRYFVCFGPKAEMVHDWIDDLIVADNSFEDVPTTFHQDESIEDVILFFRRIAMEKMRSGLVIVRDASSWRKLVEK